MPSGGSTQGDGTTKEGLHPTTKHDGSCPSIGTLTPGPTQAP